MKIIGDLVQCARCGVKFPQSQRHLVMKVSIAAAEHDRFHKKITTTDQFFCSVACMTMHYNSIIDQVADRRYAF